MFNLRRLYPASLTLFPTISVCKPVFQPTNHCFPNIPCTYPNFWAFAYPISGAWDTIPTPTPLTRHCSNSTSFDKTFLDNLKLQWVLCLTSHCPYFALFCWLSLPVFNTVPVAWLFHWHPAFELHKSKTSFRGRKLQPQYLTQTPVWSEDSTNVLIGNFYLIFH